MQTAGQWHEANNIYPFWMRSLYAWYRYMTEQDVLGQAFWKQASRKMYRSTRKGSKMILNINKQEIDALIEAIDHHGDDDLPPYRHLKEKLKRLQATSEPLKSTIQQVRTATE